MTLQIQNIEVTEAGRGWASGKAHLDGRPVCWEAYRKDVSEIRVMLASNGRWIQPDTMSAIRSAIAPTARGAMR